MNVAPDGTSGGIIIGDFCGVVSAAEVEVEVEPNTPSPDFPTLNVNPLDSVVVPFGDVLGNSLFISPISPKTPLFPLRLVGLLPLVLGTLGVPFNGAELQKFLSSL